MRGLNKIFLEKKRNTKVVDLHQIKLREFRLKKGHNLTHYHSIKMLGLTQLEIIKKDQLLNYSLPSYIKVILGGCLEDLKHIQVQIILG